MSECWAEGSTNRVSDEGGPTGATTNGAAAKPARPLTRREHEVAALVAKGLTNRQIASKLFVSERTAEYHVEQIRNKLGFHTRSQIAAWATQANGHATPMAPVQAVTVPPPIHRRVLVQSRVRALALTLLAAVIATAGGLTYLLSRPAASAPPPVDGLVQIDAGTKRFIQTIPTGTRGSQIAIGEGYVWQISYTGRTLQRIDPRTRHVTPYGTPDGAPPVGIAIGDRAIWVATAYGSKSLFRFDPRTLQFAPPIEVASGLQAIAFGANSVWATDKNDDATYRIDPLTSRVITRIPVGAGPEAIAVEGSSVWVGNGVDRSVSRIDAHSSAVVATIPLSGAPTAIAIGHGAVWIASDPGQAVTRVDAVTNGVLEIPIGGAPSDVAVSADAVWVSKGTSGGVARIDPATRRPSSVALQGLADGIASDGSTVWVSAHNQSALRAAGPASHATRGGTLRVAVPGWAFSELANSIPQPSALDPQLVRGLDSVELLRCCLLRTLYTHPGRSYQDGGADLYPDLAERLPEVSPDGRTWTFRLRHGLKYAPPLQGTEISTADVVRALMRDARASGSGDVYSVIEGFDAYRTRQASTISGLATPDRYTLTVRLNLVAGDLAERFALSQSAPIPPRPNHPTDPLGVATGHDDGYGSFLVASGPYMIAGSEALDFASDPTRQHPVSGFVPGHSLVLARNPSWQPATDQLRPAFVNAIQFSIGVSDQEAARRLQSGEADLIMRASPPPQLLPSLLLAAESDPHLGRLDVQSRDFLRTVVMNLAVPPFDDVHVRRAVNYIINKRALVDAHGGALAGSVATHYVPDSLEAGVLSNYDPYATEGATGNLELASREMKQSRYDPQHTGRCSLSVCQHVLGWSRKGATGPFPEIGGFPMLGRMMALDLSRIGIDVDLHVPTATIAVSTSPSSHNALYLTEGLAPTFMSASSTFPGDFSRAGNEALLGATSTQLRGWGYSVSEVPTIDLRINECMSIVGPARRAACWTALDIFVMEKVVPIAPYTSEKVAEVVPNRIANYAYDQSADSPALDQIALRPLSP